MARPVFRDVSFKANRCLFRDCEVVSWAVLHMAAGETEQHLGVVLGTNNLAGRHFLFMVLQRQAFPFHGIAEWTCMLCGTWNSKKKKVCRHCAARKTNGTCELLQHPGSSWIQAHPASWVRSQLFGRCATDQSKACLESLFIVRAAQQKLPRGTDTSSLSREEVYSRVFSPANIVQ